MFTKRSRIGRHRDPVAALDAAVDAFRAEPSPRLARDLLLLRARAAEAIVSTPREPWPPAFDDPFPELVGEVPEVEAADLDAEVLGAAVAHHGCLLVRGLFDAEQVARSQASVRQATDGLNGDRAAATAGWYEPTLCVDVQDVKVRRMVERSNAVWLGDSPMALAQVLDDLDTAGAVAAVAGHFGERPVISLQKSTLRRVQPALTMTGWHQDGSFLGEGTRAMNVWVALTPCGDGLPAPGLELVPARLEEIIEPDPAVGKAAIDGYGVHYVANVLGVPVVRPRFGPGDALFFDELLAHRTYIAEGMSEERLAVECWFFSPAHPNERYQSLLV